MKETNTGLPPEALCKRCDASKLDFERTDEICDGDLMLGQIRAKEALDFGLGLRHLKYNVFVAGSQAIAKEKVVRTLIGERAKTDSPPSDWCYVFNFEVPEKPILIRLPAGKAAELAGSMRKFVDEVQSSLAAAFESEEYQTRVHTIQERFHDEHEAALTELEKKAREHGLALLRSSSGFAFFPAKNGSVMPMDEIKSLSDEERKRLEVATEALQADLLHVLRKIPDQQRRMRNAVRVLDEEIARYAVHDSIEDLRSHFPGIEELNDYLSQVENDLISRSRSLLGPDGEEQSPVAAFYRGLQKGIFVRYAVNPIVSNGGEGAHVVVEDHPTMQNLVGRIEYRSEMGTLVTDLTLIKPGALHAANGGYLLIDAHKLLAQPLSWEALKRALKTGKIVIRSAQEEIGLIQTVTLEPEPTPIDVKVVLFGEPWLYYLLCELDAEFLDLFHVQVDFDDRIDRSEESERSYARLIALLARSRDLRPLDRAAVARSIEYLSRRAGDSRKLSAETKAVADLLREADFIAGSSQRDVVTEDDIHRVLEARRRRSGRIREHAYEEIVRGTRLIDTTGEATGQINGLSVVAAGQDVFATPTRITATVQMGKGNVIDIEREVELGGPIHSKGVLILSSFLGARYAADMPLSLSASLVFEQSYAEVEGDSASVAELCALLSATSGLPLRQSLAITGSVNQHGVVQPIGAVNEKVEGFFDVCTARGLTGDQGVVIPKANVKHLMLRAEVVDAVRAGQFAVYPVEHVDEAMELLTGKSMGRKAKDGTYPDGSVNALVFVRLREMAEERMEYLVVANGSGEG